MLSCQGCCYICGVNEIAAQLKLIQPPSVVRDIDVFMELMRLPQG